jgi:hypothetical protein
MFQKKKQLLPDNHCLTQCQRSGGTVSKSWENDWITLTTELQTSSFFKAPLSLAPTNSSINY